MTFTTAFALAFGSLVTTGGVNSVNCDMSTQFSLSPTAYATSGVERTFIFDYTLYFDTTFTQNESSVDMTINRTIFTCVDKSTSSLVFQFTSVEPMTIDYLIFTNDFTYAEINWQGASGRIGQQAFVVVDDSNVIQQQSVTAYTFNYFSARNDVIKFDTTSFMQQVDNFFNTFTYAGYNAGYNDGYESAKTLAYDNGYGDGYTDGYNEGVQMDDTVFTVFNGILNIALVPINFLLGIFNFEVLGINISSLVTSALTVACVIIVIKMFLGGASDDNS